MRFPFAISLPLILAAVPAAAQAGSQVPEGSNLMLFGLGLLGVIIGRRASMRKNRKDD